MWAEYMYTTLAPLKRVLQPDSTDDSCKLSANKSQFVSSIIKGYYSLPQTGVTLCHTISAGRRVAEQEWCANPHHAGLLPHHLDFGRRPVSYTHLTLPTILRV